MINTNEIILQNNRFEAASGENTPVKKICDKIILQRTIKEDSYDKEIY